MKVSHPLYQDYKSVDVEVKQKEDAGAWKHPILTLGRILLLLRRKSRIGYIWLEWRFDGASIAPSRLKA